MRKAVFTICAKNYIGLAQILEKSIKVHDDTLEFFIFIADEFGAAAGFSDLPGRTLIARNVLGIPERQWYEMAFKYDITEFCTSIKPSAFNYLFDVLNFDEVIYFDPDVYVFSSLDSIWTLLKKFKIIVTPHILTIEDQFTGSRTETGIMSTGIYNLGFLALARSESASKLLSWWSLRVFHQCFIDNDNSLFTDQKWMDFLSCYFESNVLHVSGHLGMNVAPWNFHEREVVLEEDKYLIKNRTCVESDTSSELVFAHFSGYDYSQLKTGKVIHKNISSNKEYDDILMLAMYYSDVLRDNSDILNKYLNLQYTYDFFENGIRIMLFHRRIFRSMINKGMVFDNPFDTTNDSLYYKLARARLIEYGSVNFDKITKGDLNNFSFKLRVANRVFFWIFRLIGFQNYVLILKLFKYFSRYEAHHHLVDRKF